MDYSARSGRRKDGLLGVGRVFMLIMVPMLCESVWRPKEVKCEGEPQGQVGVPQPLAHVSHVSLDGLTLVVVFDRPVDLSAAVESVEQRQAGGAAAATAYDSSSAGAAAPLAAEQSERTELRQSSRAKGPRKRRRARFTFAASRSSNRKRQASGAEARLSEGTSSRGSFRQNQTRRKSFDEVLMAAPSDRGPQEEQPKGEEQEGGPVFGCGRQEEQQVVSSQPVGGIQLCGQVLSRATLRQLRALEVRNCVWASQVQFLVQLGRPVEGGQAAQPVRVGFARGSIAGAGPRGRAARNERELSVQLRKLPLEGIAALGAADAQGGGAAGVQPAAGQLAPRLSLTGPSQVPNCGQFAISAHLWSPFGTRPGEAVRLEWTVERSVGATQANASAAATPPGLRPPAGGALSAGGDGRSAVGAQPAGGTSMGVAATDPQAAEWRWDALRRLVASQTSNNLVLDAALLDLAPQLYQFRLSATFVTSVASYKLNTSHQVSKLDYDAPIGAIYGTHMLAAPAGATPTSASAGNGDAPQHQQLNTNQPLVLLADVQVPECAAASVKQVGLYWQVSEPRVRFEQSYAPFYLARGNTLPEQALVEFRLNLFYGIRVKRVSSASATILTGDSVLDAPISGGLLMASVGQEAPEGALAARPAQHHQLELHGEPDGPEDAQQHKYSFQWSCFDGRTGQACLRGGQQAASLASPESSPMNASNSLAWGAAPPLPVALVDRVRGRQRSLRLPMAWLPADGQLWFGLQRFDRQNPGQQSRTEYALVGVQPLGPQAHSAGQQQQAGGGRAHSSQRGVGPHGRPPTVAIGPVLAGQRATRQVGAAPDEYRHFRATVRNPLTGAIVVPERVPIVLVGRLGPVSKLEAFSWRVPNYPHPLHWTVVNESAVREASGWPGSANDDQLVTQLHLNADLLVAHSSHQVQLVACWNEQTGGQSSVASVSLDIVQGVQQCRVQIELGLGDAQSQASAKPAGSEPSSGQPEPRPPTGNIPPGAWSPSVSVSFCNIPLGVSPLTYQLYLVDTSALEAPPEGASGPQTTSPSPSAATEPQEALDEADELLLEALAQPLAAPQLSPVFLLGSSAMRAALSTASLLAGARQMQASSSGAPPSAQGAQVRFAARVCHRLASCRMFYSSPVSAGRLLEAGTLPAQQQAGRPASQRQLQAAQRQQAALALHALQPLLEGARRAQTAGNSIAAIAVLNSLLQLADRMLEAAPSFSGSGGRAAEQQGGLNAGGQPLPMLSELQEQQVRELVVQASRDCVQYGASSLQRPFHYTESGQANLVLSALARIVQHKWSTLELRFRAIKLIGQLISRKIVDQTLRLNEKENQMGRALPLVALSLPDLKTIQQTFEQLFASSVFVQHSLSSTAAHQEPPLASSANPNRHLGQATAARLAAAAGQPATSGLNVSLPGEQQSQRNLEPADQRHSSVLGGRSSSRKKREAAILAYLAAIRQTHRALLQAAALQLPLGSVHQFEFQQQAGENAGLGASGQPGAASSASSAAGQDEAGAEAAPGSQTEPPIVQRAPAGQRGGAPVHIVSSLTHQTDLISDNIEVDLFEFGSVTLRFGLSADEQQAARVAPAAQQQHQQQSNGANGAEKHKQSNSNLLGNKLAKQLEARQLRCRNDTNHQLSGHNFLSRQQQANLDNASAQAQTASQQRQQQQQQGQSCSSFVLALTSFAGRAPYRALSAIPPLSPVSRAPIGSQSQRESVAGGALMLSAPIIQVDWLSPIDGSDLIELLRQDQERRPHEASREQLSAEASTANANANAQARQAASPSAPIRLDDFKASVTFTIPIAQEEQQVASQQNNNDQQQRFKCFQFDELANEWVESKELALHSSDQQAAANNNPTAGSISSDEISPSQSDNDDSSSSARSRKNSINLLTISCAFNGFGALTVFRGSPPSAQASIERRVAVGLGGVALLVAVLSILGCLASRTRERRSAGGGRTSGSSRSSISGSATNTSNSSYQDDHRRDESAARAR